MRVPPCRCHQTGSPFVHHCILSSRSMSEYGLIRSRGFCAFFFLGIGMKPRLISLFLSRLCLADLAILQPSLIVFWKEPAPLFAAMSSDAPFGYSRPGGRGAGSRLPTPSAAGVFLETGTTGLSCAHSAEWMYRQACAACRASYAVGASRGCPLTTFTPTIVPVVCVPTAVTRTLTNRLPPT